MEQNQESKKTIKVFSIVSFLNDMGSDIVFSVWPIFVTSVLGANMTILGLIDGLGDSIVSISQAISGYISDRIKKRKIFVWTGYLFAGIARIGYAFAPAWQFLIPFKILDRSGKIRGSPRDAIISEVSTRENRGKNFGILRAMDNLGAIVGTLVAIFFLTALGYRNLFLLAGIPSLIGVILILIFIKDKKIEKKEKPKPFSFKMIDNNLKLYFLSTLIFALGSFSYSFLLIFANQSGFQIVYIPALYLLFTVIAAMASIPFGKLADKIGRKNVFYMAFVFWALTLASFILLKSFIGIIIGIAIYGLFLGASQPVQKALTAELAPKEYLASVLGFFQMVIGLAGLPASLLAGMLWDKFGMTTPLYLSFGLTVIAAILLMKVKEPAAESAKLNA